MYLQAGSMLVESSIHTADASSVSAYQCSQSCASAPWGSDNTVVLLM